MNNTIKSTFEERREQLKILLESGLSSFPQATNYIRNSHVKYQAQSEDIIGDSNEDNRMVARQDGRLETQGFIKKDRLIPDLPSGDGQFCPQKTLRRKIEESDTENFNTSFHEVGATRAKKKIKSTHSRGSCIANQSVEPFARKHKAVPETETDFYSSIRLPSIPSTPVLGDVPSNNPLVSLNERLDQLSRKEAEIGIASPTKEAEESVGTGDSVMKALGVPSPNEQEESMSETTKVEQREESNDAIDSQAFMSPTGRTQLVENISLTPISIANTNTDSVILGLDIAERPPQEPNANTEQRQNSSKPYLLPTRYVYVKPCNNCTKRQQNCRVMFRGKRCCYSCAVRKVKCIGIGQDSEKELKDIHSAETLDPAEVVAELSTWPASVKLKPKSHQPEPSPYWQPIPISHPRSTPKTRGMFDRNLFERQITFESFLLERLHTYERFTLECLSAIIPGLNPPLPVATDLVGHWQATYLSNYKPISMTATQSSTIHQPDTMAAPITQDCTDRRDRDSALIIQGCST